jgi:hypothetical protein
LIIPPLLSLLVRRMGQAEPAAQQAPAAAQ